jgi:hypothetical protein
MTHRVYRTALAGLLLLPIASEAQRQATADSALVLRAWIKPRGEAPLIGRVVLQDSSRIVLRLLDDGRETSLDRVQLLMLERREMLPDSLVPRRRGAARGFAVGVGITSVLALAGYVSDQRNDFLIPAAVLGLVAGIPITAITTLIGAIAEDDPRVKWHPMPLR